MLARVGASGDGNLAITSPQDQDHYIAKEQSWGINVSVPIPIAGVPTAPPSLGLSASQLSLLGEYEAVRQQTAINAGMGGFDINVNGHTHLRGGAITTEGVIAASKLITQTLTHETLVNQEVARGQSWSVSLSIADKATDQAADSAKKSGLGPLAGSSVGYARINTNYNSNTPSSVGGVVTVTRGDLQAGKAATVKATEFDPINVRYFAAMARYQNLLNNEPPKCDNCGYEGMPGSTQGASVAANTGLNSGFDSSATASSSGGAGGSDAVTGNARWLAWYAACRAARTEMSTLLLRLNRINDKVYGEANTAALISGSSLHQPLLQTFDKGKATQELKDGVAVTAAFGKAAFKTAGDYAEQKVKDAVAACGGNSNASNCPEADKWKEGGAYRAALHAVVGAISFGQAGALGAMTAELAYRPLKDALTQAGFAEDSLAYNMLMIGAKSMIAAGVAGTGGAAAAFNADANNRQLHVDQTDAVGRRAKQLAGMDGKNAKQWEIELTEQLLRQNDITYQGFSENGRARAELSNLQATTGVSMSAEGTAAYLNPTINANQLTLNAPSYLAVGNLPGVNPRIDLLTFAFAQAINNSEFASLPAAQQRQLVVETSTFADAMNDKDSKANLNQRLMADATARAAVAWARQSGALAANFPFIPAEARMNQESTLAVMGSAIARAKAKTNDPVVGSAAERVYVNSRPIGDLLPELQGVNPHYVADVGIGVNTNCASCVNAADARFSGRDINAVASPNGGYKNQNDLLPSIPFGFEAGKYSSAEITQQMLASGNGARGVVLIEQGSGIDHVINVFNRNGSVVFVDTQIGRTVTLQPNLKLRFGRP